MQTNEDKQKLFFMDTYLQWFSFMLKSCIATQRVSCSIRDLCYCYPYIALAITLSGYFRRRKSVLLTNNRTDAGATRKVIAFRRFIRPLPRNVCTVAYHCYHIYSVQIASAFNFNNFLNYAFTFRGIYTCIYFTILESRLSSWGRKCWMIYLWLK